MSEDFGWEDEIDKYDEFLDPHRDYSDFNILDAARDIVKTSGNFKCAGCGNITSNDTVYRNRENDKMYCMPCAATFSDEKIDKIIQSIEDMCVFILHCMDVDSSYFDTELGAKTLYQISELATEHAILYDDLISTEEGMAMVESGVAAQPQIAAYAVKYEVAST